MIAKIAVLFAVVAVAYAGVLVQSPASTTLLANNVAVAAPLTVAHVAPVAHVAANVRTVPVIAAAQTVVAAPTVIQTGHKIVQTLEPLEQHGYRIQY